jgi:hypothetical protein
MVSKISSIPHEAARGTDIELKTGGASVKWAVLQGEVVLKKGINWEIIRERMR